MNGEAGDGPRVTGVGGVFIRARDHDALRRWYSERLGIEFEAGGSIALPTAAPGAPPVTVFAIFDSDTTYLADATERFMLNLSVADLDGMIAKLRDAGETVSDPIEEDQIGRFAWLTDPEGTRVELWEPAAPPPDAAG